MSTDGNTSIPDRLARQLAGQCLYGRCTEPAKDDADFCAPHHEVVKQWKRGWAKKQRKAIRKARQCRDCGKASKRVRCPACRKRHREAEKIRRGVERGSRGVEHASRQPLTKLEVHPDGYTRVRTIGRGVRGQKSRAELDDDLRQSLTDADTNLRWVRDEGIAQLRSAAVDSLGRIQKREAMAIVADRLHQAVREITSVAESLCPGRAGELAAVMAEAEDE